MPGIAAIVGRGSDTEYRHQLREMLASMRHEPSYVSGEAFVPELGVWSGWLAHAGSFASRVSSFRLPDGSAVLLAGECFPGAEGVDVAQVADAELFAICLIEGYRQEGPTYLKRLNGAFSGLLIDRTLGQSVVFNDRFGSERIYVHQDKESSLFASEAKALLRVRPALRTLEPRSIAKYLAFGSVSGGQTLFQGIDLMPGASAWTIGHAGHFDQCRYFSAAEWTASPELGEHDFQDSFSALMRRIVPAYVAGEQTVGVSITGGLDTRMIMASLPAHAHPGVCYTYGGLEGLTLDARLGARVADVCGWPHHVIRIEPDFLEDYSRYVDRTVYVTDGCAGPLEAHEIYLTERASRLAKVRLTGNYGSEVLRGMSTRKRQSLAPGLLSPSLAASVASVVMPGSESHPVIEAAFDEIPQHLFGTLAAARATVVVRTPYMDNELVRLACRAPAELRRTATSALRLIRDHSPQLAEIPTDQGRIPADQHPGRLRSRLRSAGAAVSFKLDYWHKEGLPRAINWSRPVLEFLATQGTLGKHKYLPYRAWFRDDLRAYVSDVLTDPQTARASHWTPDGLRRVAEDHFTGRRNCVREIHAVLALEAVERTLIKQQCTV